MATHPESNGAPADPGHRVALKTLAQIRAEASRIYRAAIRGEITPLDCTRLTRTLEILSNLAEREELESKLAEIEKKLQEASQWADQPHVTALRELRKN